MVITATVRPTTTLQPLLFLNPTKLHHHRLNHRLHHPIQTLPLSSPPKPFPCLISTKPHILKPHAALIPPLNPSNFLFSAEPIKETLSNSSEIALKILSAIPVKGTLANALAFSLAACRHLTANITAISVKETLANALAVTLAAWRHLTVKIANALATTLAAWREKVTAILVKEILANPLATALAVCRHLTVRIGNALSTTLAAWRAQVTAILVKEILANALSTALAAWRDLTVKLSSLTLEECVRVLASRVAALSMHEFKEPLVQVAFQAGKWVELYHSVLIVRILLGWFPNLPWERQPFSAMRDLCDPFLGFCRTVWPPMGPREASVDMSPIVAMLFLGVVSSLLKGGSPLGLPF